MPVAPLFRPIDVAPAYQKVADAIEREIVNGRIKPGDPIGTEHDLVRQFGVNRSTIREGIRVLEEGGLIRRDSSRRLHACLPRYSKLASRLSRALVLHEVTFRELYEASMTLEVAGIEGAVERASDENLAELDDNLVRSGPWSAIPRGWPNATPNSTFWSPRPRRTGCSSSRVSPQHNCSIRPPR